MPIIYRFLLASVGDRDLAETLTQECFMKAYRNRPSFRGESSVRTWLVRIAINLQKDHWRNRRMRFWRETQVNAIDVDVACDRLPSAERSPEAQMLAREQTAQVWKIAQGLQYARAERLSAAICGRTRITRDQASHRTESGGCQSVSCTSPSKGPRVIGEGRQISQ
jgi:RNA polymerase sigma factor (sigma-70 family)